MFQGVLTLKNTYFEPRYVLVMPLDKEAHEHRLRDRGLYTEEQMEQTLKRADIYCKYNQDHPGFFDMMISSGEYKLPATGCTDYTPGCSEHYQLQRRHGSMVHLP